VQIRLKLGGTAESIRPKYIFGYTWDFFMRRGAQMKF